MYQEPLRRPRRRWVEHQPCSQGECVPSRHGGFREDERGVYDVLGQHQAVQDVSWILSSNVYDLEGERLTRDFEQMCGGQDTAIEY